MAFGISYEGAIVVVQNIGIVHIFVLYLSHYVSYMYTANDWQHVDPLSPYAISREVVHMDTFVGLVPKAAPGGT